MDLFAKVINEAGTPIAQFSRAAYGSAAFPVLTGESGSRMTYAGSEQIIWSLNNCLGLANHPEVRAADAEFGARYGLGSPMGARIVSGETDQHRLLEEEVAQHVGKPAALLLNWGYQGMLSLIDTLLTRHDWLVYDSASHACITDAARLHRGRKRSFRHNDVERLEAQLERIERERAEDEAVLVVTEGMFSMSGEQGRLREIVALKERYDFRLLVDDAHGWGVLGDTGAGTGQEQGCQDDIDLYFGSFHKAAACLGAFVASDPEIIWKLRFQMRSQVHSKGLPLPIVAGNRVRLDIMRRQPELRLRCREIAAHLQDALRARGMDIGHTTTPITPVYLDLDPLRTVEYIERISKEYNVFCSPVIYPAAPLGVVQLRLVATADHRFEDIPPTVDAICTVYEQMTGRPVQDLPRSRSTTYSEVDPAETLAGR
jgi:glycine C-acetyltransferase